MRVLHRCQLDAGFIIDFTLTDIRTVKDVVIIVKPHQSILLLSYLVFLEIGAALALIPLHLAPLILHQVGLSNVCVSLRVRRLDAIHSLAHAVVLRHVSSLPLCTIINSIAVIIILSLSAILIIYMLHLHVIYVSMAIIYNALIAKGITMFQSLQFVCSGTFLPLFCRLAFC